MLMRGGGDEFRGRARGLMGALVDEGNL